MVQTERERRQRAPGALVARGLPRAAALIVGSVVGVAIFDLPYPLAGIVCVNVAAMAFALVFSALPRGLFPCAGAQVLFENGVGFTNARSSRVTAGARNAAVGAGGVAAVPGTPAPGVPVHLPMRRRTTRPAPVPGST